MTTDAFNELKRRHRNGSVSKIDFEKLVEELLLRDARWHAALADLRRRFDETRDAFILMLEDD